MTIINTTQLIYDRDNDDEMEKWRQIRDTLILLGYEEEESEFHITFTLETETRCEVNL